MGHIGENTMSKSELIAAIEAEKTHTGNQSGPIAYDRALNDCISIIKEHLEGKVIVPVEDLKVMITCDGSVNDLDTYCLAMEPEDITDHVLGMLSTIAGDEK